MPFETATAAPRKIAVIGAGISGMGAAHLLAKDHRVVLYEAEAAIGGHSRTRAAGRKGDLSVDTGFIVFNYANYPNLAKLFEHLDVPVTESTMSFGASFDGGRLEYALSSLDSLFAQRRNTVNPRFLRMLRDVMTFNKRGLEVSQEPGLTIGGLMQRLRLSDYFRDHYLLPFSGAIWSTPKARIMDFPADTLMRFFDNHALLSVYGQHQWYTVKGGSREYVNRLEADMDRRGVDIRVATPVQQVRRTPFGAEVKTAGAEWESFDEVVFASHSDQTLRMLADPTPEETATLGAVRYQPNRVVLHGDESIMPKRKSVWASWIYTEDRNKTSDVIDLTYWMNSLQPWLGAENVMVTLNSQRDIDPALIWDECVLHHPVYDTAALAAQQVARRINGQNRTWFCGAWMKNGFHEDGLSSAYDVVHALNAQERLEVAAE